MTFPTNFNDILERINQIDPVKYGYSRNYINGAVTYLSPYISRGVISTKQIKETILQRGFTPEEIEKFLQELAWRDFWQLIWLEKKELINHDLKNEQTRKAHYGIPKALINAATGIDAIDKGINQLYETGYIHNHIRMYLASIACNIGQYAWLEPARWMYYHLLDADWASNALSWQWVCGANSSKLYFANQENINKYCNTTQSDTFLDLTYDKLYYTEIPDILKSSVNETFNTDLPLTVIPLINNNLPTLIYNFYNLDPSWKKDIDANRILLLEPSVFNQYPVSQKSINFCIELALNNIPNIQIYVAEFKELQQLVSNEIYFKEHPLNHYQGIEESRDWMFYTKNHYNSFFKFWNSSIKEL